MTREIQVQKIKISKNSPLTLILGPCVMEDEEMTFQAAKTLKEIVKPFNFQLIFKASYDKANRSSIDSFRGIGLQKGLTVLQKIQKELDLPCVTDVHTEEEAEIAGDLLSMIQIPAFLSRQTDLLLKAAKTKAVINIKKGQFLSPWDMIHVIKKIESQNKKDLLLTDRGTSFGYNNLVSDMRAIPIMQNFGYPVCFDASHSVQLPGGLGSSSGGQREFIPTLAKAALAAGADLLFIECHPNPPAAKSDSATVFPFDRLPELLTQIQKLDKALRS